MVNGTVPGTIVLTVGSWWKDKTPGVSIAPTRTAGNTSYYRVGQSIYPSFFLRIAPTRTAREQPAFQILLIIKTQLNIGLGLI